ncbi:tautomerase family protein [Curvibacter lanceolatus]|uniref:tautomerase family protein n=1 Tax=Curvibacter lanceolatus TaxID=86182 RepID=UPI000382E608|nr:tautomerase family protein [Curvibacter lanceolatus]
MPFIEVKILEGVLPEHKVPELMAALTEAVVRVGGEGFRPMTRCVVQEVRSGWWAAAGKPLSTEGALQSLQAAQPASLPGPA